MPRRVRPCHSETRHMRRRAFTCLDACGRATRKLDRRQGSLSRASTRAALPLGNSTHATEAFHVPRRVWPCHSETRQMPGQPFMCLDACGPTGSETFAFCPNDRWGGVRDEPKECLRGRLRAALLVGNLTCAREGFPRALTRIAGAFHVRSHETLRDLSRSVNLEAGRSTETCTLCLSTLDGFLFKS